MLDLRKEAGAFVGIMPELVAKNSEGARRVPKAPGDFSGRSAVNQEGSQGFILSVEGFFGGEEKTRVFRKCYLIAMSDRHR
jgi:hypothetical protein